MKSSFHIKNQGFFSRNANPFPGQSIVGRGRLYALLQKSRKKVGNNFFSDIEGYIST